MRKRDAPMGGASKRSVRDLNGLLQGWFAYFKHSKGNVFARIDRDTRGRLRSILRKRSGGYGRGRGRDHQHWPKAFFHAHGLLSLSHCRAALLQPP